MRELETNEMFQVSGAGSSPQPPSGDGCDSTCKVKNNNGYGNGAESGPPPGHSGDHNPQLTTWNSGPKGPR